ncbi:MAG: tryptophan synthase subunit alpha [Chloroflexi bacterium]|nr:tryptophan synthase subunit alpha [Chloroflexota bacterium]MCI0576937.1 tryptophan synthase subunit alpha [Chloroflexota bacterium]MCI0644769.1 tryptophan synthase subunit alpha [Chloroflexota bacterium]MCI0731321.1 tryptophan synthase subunit alpha [Chloroflexota bacterium]
MPYYTLGYPDRETSLAVIEAIAPYSDLLELGVPFSDPIADGPTIQRSTQRALEQGATTAGCLEMVRALRARGLETPALLMGYYNPILAFGEARYMAAAAEAGADGFIVPDLPPEEAETLERLAAEAGLVLVHFLAPTSNPRRIAAVAARAKGFIYLVSLTGITGARANLSGGLADFVGRVRAQTRAPLAVGFGISTPAQAAEVGRLADGVIVGSAVINAVDAAEKNKAAAAAAFIRQLYDALRRE